MATAAAAGLALALLAGCGGSGGPGPRQQAGSYKLGTPYEINGRWYYPEFDPRYERTGVASWYGEPFHGRETANGEIFDKGLITAAHPTLPLPSVVRVTNLDNGRSLDVRVNDRGPFIGDRLIDLSQAAAGRLGYEDGGLARVRVRFIGLADDARGIPPVPTTTAPGDTLYAAAEPRPPAPPPVPRSPPPTVAGEGTPPSAFPRSREVAAPPPPTVLPLPTPASPPPRVVVAELEPAVPPPSAQPRGAWPVTPVAEPRTAAPPVRPAAGPVSPRPAPLPSRVLPVQRAAAQARPSVCFAGPHYVEVGAFADGAGIHRATVALRHLERVVVEPYFAAGQALARVRLGPLASRTAAAPVLEQARALGYPAATLVPATASRPAPTTPC